MGRPSLYFWIVLVTLYKPELLTESHAIASIENLCRALDVTQSELEQIRNTPGESRYTRTEAPRKADGSIREVYNPSPAIRRIQRRINHRILSNIELILWPDHVFGSIPNQIYSEGSEARDYVACASQHCGAKSLLKLDIKDFFNNVHLGSVQKLFSELFHYADDVSEALADVCCLNGHLVQGALTSSYIASLVLHDIEGDVVKRLQYKGLTYTRYVDDITISTKISNYDFSFAQSVVGKMLAERDLPLNLDKVQRQYASLVPLTVHGLRVAFSTPRLPSDEVGRIRAAVKNLEILSQEGSYRCSHAYRHDFNRCMGRVNKLQRVNHLQHPKLVARLLKIQPLPSKRDLERIQMIIARLVKDHPRRSDTFWYKQRFYLAHERLNVLRRSFPKQADEHRKLLRTLKPTFLD